jgi:hypothetical protein
VGNLLANHSVRGSHHELPQIALSYKLLAKCAIRSRPFSICSFEQA